MYKLFFIGLVLFFYQSLGWAQTRLDVEIEPANKAVEDNIQAYIGALEESTSELTRRQRHALIEQARNASEALGYYEAKFQLTQDKHDPAQLKLHVDLGEPVLLRTVDVKIIGEANELEVFKRLAHNDLRAGDVLNHGIYDALKTTLQQQALRYGFFAARFTRQQLEIDPEAGFADVYLYFDSGPRYSLGEVEFLGPIDIDESLLHRLIPFSEGEPYNALLLAKLSQNLQGTGYFDQIRVDAVGEPGGELEIPVRVHLQPVKPRTFGVGVGFSTDVGPRARFNWEQHRINSAGHQLGLSSEWSKPQQSVTGWYGIPLSKPLTDQLRFVAGYKREEYVDAHSRRYSYGVQWHKQINQGWQRILGLRWEEERYDYGRQEPNQRRRFLLPSIGLSKIEADSALDPSVGYRLQIDMSGAQEDVLSDADLLHVNALARGLVTLAERHRILGRVQIGAIATNDYSKIPPSLRFFAGGDQSVRGYAYQSLSPRDSKGNRVGGRYLFVQSLEYQYGLTDHWRLASFVDRGNAVDSLTDAMKVGVGVGIRWVSPIGPLRLDLAHALHDDRGWRIHFSMGPEL